MRAIADASVIIALVQIDLLHQLSGLFDELVIAPAVRREITPTVPTLPTWITVSPPVDDAGGPALPGLGPGETESIRLALRQRPDGLLMDEKAARKAALQLGLPVMGTIGLLVRAKRAGASRSGRPELRRSASCRVSDFSPVARGRARRRGRGCPAARRRATLTHADKIA